MRYVPGFRFLPYFVALVLSSVSACLTSPSGPPPQEPTTITLSTYLIVFTAVNEHERIDATVLDQDSRVIADATVNWRSADNSVARVSDRGVVTAAGSGKTQIIVSSGYATATATVSVEQTADSIEITPSSIVLGNVGATFQFTAVVHDSNDRIIPGAAVTWSSSHPEIVTVDANGLVTAVSPGEALITASSGRVSTSRPVYVEVAPEPSRIVLNVSEATLTAAGQSLQLHAEVYDSEGAAIPGAQVTWSSSDPSIATVGANGLVIAVSNGTTRITASSGDATAHALIHVVIEGTEPPEPPPEPPEPPEPPVPPEPPPVASADRDALVAFYHATDGPNWTNNTNWLSEAPLGEWHAVTTDNNGRVTGLRLKDNNLAGALPPEIGQMKSLERLNLYNNRIGGVIPPEIGQLGELSVLTLSRNQFTGVIPPELGQLSNLWEMNLSDNQLNGEIPSALFRLRSLEILQMSGNQLSGEIPSEIRQLIKLRSLSLGGNQLSGEIPPEIVQLDKLESLLLDGNRLTGEIPSGVGNLSALNVIWFQQNRLTGEIPSEIGKLGNLTQLMLDANLFVGEIPSEIGRLTELSHLDLSENQLTGEIPSAIGNLTSLVTLRFFGNQLSGGIPVETGRLKNLTELNLGNNENLAGPFPIEITTVSSLRFLFVDGTRLCVPSNETFMTWLAGIEVKSGVSFCEDEDEPEPLSDRDVLVALYNATDGPNWTNNDNWLSDKPIGEWYGVDTDADGRVTWLNLTENSLKGYLPSSLGALSNLKGLDLRQNELEGSIPPSLGDLSDLTFLNLSYNELKGSIPSTLGNLSELSQFSLEGNGLTGPIPPWLEDLSKLRILALGKNNLTGSIPSWLGDLSNLIQLSAEVNALTGSIPSELGDLSNLMTLNFGHNALTGSIPSSLGDLSELISLYLDNNGLTDSIPSSLTNLTKLRHLRLGDNELTGCIPPSLRDVQVNDMESIDLPDCE